MLIGVEVGESAESGIDLVHVTAARLYDAECALRAACQSHVELWIAAASAKLRCALRDHLAATDAPLQSG